jgi:glycine cleavage system regulatory protein
MAQIVKAYKANRGENLIDVIKKECAGNFERILVALCNSAIEFECELIESHLKLIGTDEEAILKVLLCKSNEDLEELKKKFKELYNKDLESQVCPFVL